MTAEEQAKAKADANKDLADRLAYELGCAVSVCKAAAAYEPEVRQLFYAKLLPEHVELLDLFQEAGGQVAGRG